MPIVSVTLNARESNAGIPDIKYIRKIKAKTLQEAVNLTIEELKLAVPKCEVITVESNVVAE
jgi:hypothetical protein